jgi:transposase
MELVPIHKRVVGLDIHQAQVTACAILEEADGETRIEQRQFGAFKTVVNARHVKQVPGRKTDVGDAQWLATLARAGLLRGSFVPPAKLRELRVISRQRQKWVSLLAAEKNRMHKVLTDAGIRLGVVVSDIHGQSARAMIKVTGNSAAFPGPAYGACRCNGERSGLAAKSCFQQRGVSS